MSRSKAEPLLLLRIANESAETRIPRKLLGELLEAAYRARRKTPASLDLAVLDDRAMAKLNRRHLRRDRPTDVLAFDDGEADSDGRLRLGDVAVSAETARREAGARGVRFTHELAFYALHGLLHLLGMDDGDGEGREEMLKAQLQAMREFGLPVGDGLL